MGEKHGVKPAIPKVVRGVTVEDQPVPNHFTTESTCYGGVVIDDKEQELLRLPPKFAVYGEVDPVECMGEVEKGLAKLRWSRNYRDDEAEERREYFYPSTKTFDYGNM